jgi:DNA modification methylase
VTPYYNEDGITIWHGDCRDVLPTLEPVGLAFADPPYGVGLEYGGDYVDAGGDGYRRWMNDLAADLQRLAPVVFVTPGIRNLHQWPAPTWVLSWQKPGSMRRSDLGGFNEWEPILMYGKRRLYHDSLRLPAWNNHSHGTTGDHPCPKPLRLMTWLVMEGSDEGATVLDPFMGSGTTLRAAKDCGRKAIGIEVEESYCEIAVKRLAQGVLDFGAVV